MLDRAEYEKKVALPVVGGVTTVIKLYPTGVSPDIIFEHLVIREILYLQTNPIPTDPRIPRDAKDKLLQVIGYGAY